MDSPIIAHLHANPTTFTVDELQMALRNQGVRLTLIEIERELRASKLAKEVEPGLWVAVPEVAESKQRSLFT